MLTLEEVENITFELGEKIGINKESDVYPLFSKTSKVFSEGPSIYINSSKYHYVIMDRGQIQKHLESNNINDILYEIFKGITSSMARSIELEQRKETTDSRRVWFKIQLELLNKINPKFAELRNKEMEDILKLSPFRN